MGDKSKKLTFDERLQLMYAKGARYYEDEPVYGSTMEDIEMDAVSAYCNKIGYGKSPEEYIRQNKDYIVKVNGREEIIINAIGHRDYSIKGTDIQIKMFDDHMMVESPGTLPGIVRLNNMRQVHFSRNPKIVELLHEYEYVREFGEGVDRIYYEMEKVGLPDPKYCEESFMLQVTIWNKKIDDMTQVTTQVATQVTTQVAVQNKILKYCTVPRKKAEIAEYCGFKGMKNFTKNYLKPLIDTGKITMTIPDKPKSQNQRYVVVMDKRNQKLKSDK